jgi:hypothetical protein
MASSQSASQPAGTRESDKSKEPQKTNKPLEEDDEFEDFPVEGTSDTCYTHSPSLVLTMTCQQIGQMRKPTGKAGRARTCGRRVGMTTIPLTISPPN